MKTRNHEIDLHSPVGSSGGFFPFPSFYPFLYSYIRAIAHPGGHKDIATLELLRRQGNIPFLLNQDLNVDSS